MLKRKIGMQYALDGDGQPHIDGIADERHLERFLEKVSCVGDADACLAIASSVKCLGRVLLNISLDAIGHIQIGTCGLPGSLVD